LLATTTLSGVSTSSAGLATLTGSSHTQTASSQILPKCFPYCDD
jgi:hypothetical protein